MSKKKINVALLFGGKSLEHEVSISSAKEILKNIDKSKYNVTPILISKKGKGFEKIIKKKFDIAFIAIHGGAGEDGTIQGFLESLDIPYTGSGVLASAIGMDKLLFRKLLLSEGVRIPEFSINNNKGLKTTSYFVKPNKQGSSVGAFMVNTKTELKKAISEAMKYDSVVLVDEYVKGIEVTCPVMGNEKAVALPVIEIVPKAKFFDYKSKYTNNGTEEIVPARISNKLTKEIQDLSVKIYKLVGCRGFARVDFILKNGKIPYCLEINTIPGLTSNSLFPKSAKAANLSYTQLLDKIIQYGLEK